MQNVNEAYFYIALTPVRFVYWQMFLLLYTDERNVAWTSIWSFFRKKNFNKDFPIIMSYAFAAAKEKMIGAGDINVQSMIA